MAVFGVVFPCVWLWLVSGRVGFSSFTWLSSAEAAFVGLANLTRQSLTPLLLSSTTEHSRDSTRRPRREGSLQ